MKGILYVIIITVFSIAGTAAAPNRSIEDRPTEERRIGAMILEIQAALKAPAGPKSLETIAKYGTDTRYYVMIRGWLVQLKSGTQSQLDSARDPVLKAKHQTMNDFLAKAIRRIDLE